MHQVEQLRALGHDVDVVHVKGYLSRWNYVKGALAVLRATWLRCYDVVHVHYGLTGLCTLIRWRTPVVVTLHGSDVLQGRLQRYVSKFVAATSDAIIVVSQALADRCGGRVIPCGVNLEQFHPLNRAQTRLSLRLSDAGKYVLFPFDPKRKVKRYDIAAAAISLLRQKGIEVSLLPVWDVPNERMPLYYSAADAMVLCSDTEGSPTSVKEALACNLPVVSTDVGDSRIILEGIEGAEICEQNAPSVAAALARALERRDGVGQRGRSAMRRYDQVATVAALLEVYGSVRRRRSHRPNGDRSRPLA